MILITPICPHSMSARSIIASANDEITIEVPADRNFESVDLGVTLDGQAFLPLKSGDGMKVRKASEVTRLIKTDDRTFFEALKSKLS